MEYTKREISWVALTILVVALVVFMATQEITFGSAPSGLPAGLASTSQVVVTATTVINPVATSTSCAARIIATASTTALVTIGNAVPNVGYGYFIAASTTQVFDGGIYGCGALKIYPVTTGSITVTETY